MKTYTSGTTTLTRDVFYARYHKKPNRLARLATWWLETVCALTGHFHGCLLLNSWVAGRPGRAWHHLLRRLYDAGDEFTGWQRLS